MIADTVHRMTEPTEEEDVITKEQDSPLTKVTGEIWILGGGKFGRQAIRQIEQKLPKTTIVVVDRISAQLSSSSIIPVQAEAVDWLARHLPGHSSPGAIIPAVPLHLALEWLKKKMTTKGYCCTDVDLPGGLLARLPNPFRMQTGQAVASHADFICPDYCPEPAMNCFHTGKPRPEPLHNLIRQEARNFFYPLIVRSRQLGPGVGGFLPEDLLDLYHGAQKLIGETLLVGTACKCHGIIGAIRFEHPTQKK